ncbi:hypothetical protein [Ureibacillus acetophenoni]|uniref:Flagellar hook-length control protein FliK n=1 Tax=Ureibacillus acetophenoni TaxID=614649 RepID=A0A285U179_9BACL|nr:hypothetical protein [Ureibacillus acetophenoni]SOC35493.1 hypothetical protein SAMN05877842_101455 [Ureibacillus acetophenoni]
MSFTSLTPIQIQQSNKTQNQPLTLKQGQVLHGTVKKLYPDQIAEVQVGGHKFLAKLETPLKAGDSHFLQVTSISPQTELKVVTGPMNASDSMKQQIQQLLDSMNLPKTANMMQLAAHFIKEQVPITKEQFQLAQNLLNMVDSLSKKDAILAIQKIIESNMPLTKEIFQAVLHGSKTNGMSQELATFTQQLKDSSISDKTKSAILENLNNISKPLDSMKGGLVIARAIQTLFSETEPIANKLFTLNLLKEASVIPKQATLSNWSESTLHQAKHNDGQILHSARNVVQAIQIMDEKNAPNLINQVKLWIQNEQNLNPSQKSELTSFINRFENMPKTTQTIQQFSMQLNDLLLRAYSSNITNQSIAQNSNGSTAISQLLSLVNEDSMSNELKLLSNVAKVVNESTQPQIQSLNEKVEQQLKSTLDGYTVQLAIKNVLKSLGVNYEIALNKSIEEIEQISDQLKPNLLSLIKEGAVSPLKDSAEILLARMNGMQLLSGENGHQHQLIMQIPLQFFGKSMDATLQWNAKMNDNGKIDSDYARILFYLDMESLKETVVDMQVQNRIVSITLFNENNNLQTIAEVYQNVLKQKLSEKGYYLSGIFYKTFGKTANESTVKNSRQEQIEGSKFNGVDIRV